MAINKKLIHFETFSNFNSQKLSANKENTQYTLGIDGEIQTGSPDILYQSIVYIKDTKQQWTHGQLYDGSQLISGTNIKTINGQSLLGNGDLEIQGLKTYTFEYDDNNNSFEKFVTISQEELNKVLEADKIYIKNGDILVEVTVKEQSDISLYLIGYANDVDVNRYTIIINKSDLTYWIYFRHYSLLTNEDLSINYGSVLIPYIEDGLILEEQYIPVEYGDSITVLVVENEELGYIHHLYSAASDYNGDYIVFYGKYTDTSLLKATYDQENLTITFNIIEQSGGNSSSGGAYALVEHGTNDTTYTLTPNTFHVWGEVTSLTLTFGEEQSGVANEYLFQFECGEEATTLALPDCIIWANDDTPVIESKCTYQVSILNGFATFMKFKKNNDIKIVFPLFLYSSDTPNEESIWLYNTIVEYCIINDTNIFDPVRLNGDVYINDKLIDGFEFIGDMVEVTSPDSFDLGYIYSSGKVNF